MTVEQIADLVAVNNLMSNNQNVCIHLLIMYGHAWICGSRMGYLWMLLVPGSSGFPNKFRLGWSMVDCHGLGVGLMGNELDKFPDEFGQVIYCYLLLGGLCNDDP